MESPVDVFRNTLAATGGDNIAAILTIREQFGLSPQQAKEIMLQSNGTAENLDEHQDLFVTPLKTYLDRMQTIEAWYAIPDDEPLVQLFLPDGGQWGEIRKCDAGLQIELFAPQGHTSWVVDAEELLHAIAIAKRKLLDD